MAAVADQHEESTIVASCSGHVQQQPANQPPATSKTQPAAAARQGCEQVQERSGGPTQKATVPKWVVEELWRVANAKRRNAWNKWKKKFHASIGKEELAKSRVARKANRR